MVLMSREIGCGHGALERLAAVVGLVGGLSGDVYTSHLEAIEVATTAVAQDLMSEAATELHNMAKATDDDTPPDSGPGEEAVPPVDVAVSCDGTWQRRGHQSLYGVQAAISADTKKVLDYEIQSKF
jgi:hypothetical protein